ncbi:MAG: beta-ketoacyl synthase chain length factor [Burkholderiaceae bacterium]
MFTSSGGDGLNCHLLCEALADPAPQVSPTRFANSVHNAPAGYWGIATGSMKPSASLCAFDGSFAAGLLEAAINLLADDEPVALVAYDTPYPSPLNEKRLITGTLGIALLLVAPGSQPSLATLDIGGYERGPGPRGWPIRASMRCAAVSRPRAACPCWPRSPAGRRPR